MYAHICEKLDKIMHIPTNDPRVDVNSTLMEKLGLAMVNEFVHKSKQASSMGAFTILPVQQFKHRLTDHDDYNSLRDPLDAVVLKNKLNFVYLLIPSQQ